MRSRIARALVAAASAGSEGSAEPSVRFAVATPCVSDGTILYTLSFHGDDRARVFSVRLIPPTFPDHSSPLGNAEPVRIRGAQLLGSSELRPLLPPDPTPRGASAPVLTKDLRLRAHATGILTVRYELAPVLEPPPATDYRLTFKLLPRTTRGKRTTVAPRTLRSLQPRF